jgi:hypothetical protein
VGRGPPVQGLTRVNSMSRANNILFYSVTTYVEQVGRRRSIHHANTLDTLECIYNGPTMSIEDWIPKIGQSHPDYTSMTVDSVEITNQVAYITELRVAYVGKLYGMGPVAIGESAHWGESSWTTASIVTTPYQTTTQVLNGGILQSVPTTAYVKSYVSYSYICRYQVRTATFKTITKTPDLIIGNSGNSGIFSQHTWKSGQSFLDSPTGVVQSALVFETDMIDRSVNSLNNGWYEVAESWGPQPVITSSVINLA